MKTEKNYVKIDSRNRITIPKGMLKDLANIYKIYEKGGNIILEPVIEVPKEEKWLFDPKNKELVQELKKALEQKADKTIDLDDLEKKKSAKKRKKLTSLEIDTRGLVFDRDEANER